MANVSNLKENSKRKMVRAKHTHTKNWLTMEIKSRSKIFILKRAAAKNQSYQSMNPVLTEAPGPRSWPSGSNIQDFVATTAWYPKKLSSWMATLCAAKGNQSHLSVRQASQMPPK